MNFNVFQRISKYFQRKSGAFTLMELLLVVGITAILAGVGVGVYVNQQKAKILENTAQEIANYLRYAQQKSVSQEQGLQWGVHFDNLTSGSNFYALYTGDTYSSSVEKETKYLPAGIEFQTPSSNSSSSISFNKLTGINYDSIEKEIVIRLTSNLSARVIRATANGLITIGEGEKGYWKFDEGSGTTASDSTIYKNTGTLYNSPTWQAESNCVSGSCLSFDGTDDYVNVSTFNQPSFTTITAWIRVSSMPSVYSAKIVGTANAYLELYSGGGLVFWVNNGTNMDNVGYTISANNWYHVVAVFANNNQQLYINGAAQTPKSRTGSIPITTGLTFSNSYPPSSGYNGAFNGTIDEVRIYNRALSPAEILQHYNSRS